jgi:excisionase family DNA binding protein
MEGPMTTITERIWLTPEQVSKRLQVPVETLRTWRARGRGPAWVKLGRHIRYDASRLDRWCRPDDD